MFKDCQTNPPRATVLDNLCYDERERNMRESDCAAVLSGCSFVQSAKRNGNKEKEKGFKQTAYCFGK